MKQIYLAAALLFIVLFLSCGSYPTSPIKGEISSVTITKRSLENHEETVIVSSKSDLKDIHNSLRTVWKPIGVIGSFEGTPKFKMQISYEDGSSEMLSFTRTEFISGGYPPEKFIRIVDKIFAEREAAGTH